MYEYSFNPCFNGSMYKNTLGLWCGCNPHFVSILVLMDLCIKTPTMDSFFDEFGSFNPCFNGSMYKNIAQSFWIILE